jgi:hypothetical protein
VISAEMAVDCAQHAYIQAYILRYTTYVASHLPMPPAVDEEVKHKLSEWESAIGYLTELVYQGQLMAQQTHDMR